MSEGFSTKDMIMCSLLLLNIHKQNTLIAFDYLILTFEDKRPGTNTRYFLKTLFLSFVIKTLKHYFPLYILVIDRLRFSRKIKYTS